MAHSNRSKNNPKAGREPTPEELKRYREASGLNQQQAADLIYTSVRNWQNWEQGDAGRRMPASAFELFLLKTGLFGFTSPLTMRPDGKVLVRLRLVNGVPLVLGKPLEEDQGAGGFQREVKR